MGFNYLMTCDVEEHSIEKNTLDEGVIALINDQGLPRLLRLFDKHDIRCTFFFTGFFAERSPESLRLVKNQGHEVGCHSYSHDPGLALDKLSYKQQIREILKAKVLIEEIVGKIVSFRAPALRINKYTMEALVFCGFEYDSSLSPRRFDGPMSSGAIQKMKYFNSKEGIHFIKSRNPKFEGKGITEVPITACVLPYIGTLSRISPALIDILRPIVMHRSKKNSYPLVFDTHPNECVDLVGHPITTRRSDGLINYLFGDLLRHKLKLKNMGEPAIKLLDKEIKIAKKNNFSFRTVNQMSIDR